ncbi:MAG: hypothetical protein ACOYL6_01225 [Bacteriovoracaceae bacterium]
MKKLLFLNLAFTFSAPLYAVKGVSTFTLSDEMSSSEVKTEKTTEEKVEKNEVVAKGLRRAPAEETYYIDPESVDINDPVAVAKEKARIRENLEIKRQEDWYWRRNRGAR